MICAWKALLGILPLWLRDDVDRQGRDSLLELRMRINSPPELVQQNGNFWMSRNATQEDISFCINMASRYSPWAASTISQGYITAPGGHRIGVCGEAVCKDGKLSGIKNVRSICIRIARDFPGIANGINIKERSILILGAPGWGKTTLLRDLIRRVSQKEIVAVVDERGELCPDTIPIGKRVDILTGCAKSMGMEMVLRTMGPSRIAVDEITAAEDAQALIHAVGCGVGILATAHASSVSDMCARPIYRKIWEARIFDAIVILHPDKTYHEERFPV